MCQILPANRSCPMRAGAREGAASRKNACLVFRVMNFLKSRIAGTSGAVGAFFEYFLVDFFPVDWDFGRCLSPDTYLRSFYTDN